MRAAQLKQPQTFIRDGQPHVYAAGTPIRIPAHWREEVPRQHRAGYAHSVQVHGMVVVWLDGMFRAVESHSI